MSEQVKRYFMCDQPAEMVEDEIGAYVHWIDYEKLQKENAELKERIKCGECGGTDLVCAKGWQKERNKLKEENARYRKALQYIFDNCESEQEKWAEKTAEEALKEGEE